jgi:hypothetical protein
VNEFRALAQFVQDELDGEGAGGLGDIEFHLDFLSGVALVTGVAAR